MAIKFLAKKYYTFAELADRWSCIPRDLIQPVIDGQIVASFHMPFGAYEAMQLEPIDDDGLTLVPAAIWNWESKTDSPEEMHNLTGFFYLIFPRRTGAWDCTYRYFSDKPRGHGELDICFRLEMNIDISDVIDSGFVMAEEVARVEAEGTEKVVEVVPDTPLATRERQTLLTIIAVLCKEAKLDYTTASKTAGLIQSTATTMGVSIGETTIEGHLKKIPEALGTRTR